MNEIKIILADDHPVVRQGLRALIESEANLFVIGEASNGLKTIDLVEELQPDVLVLDWMMPGLNGLEVTRELGKKLFQPKIIILSMHTSEVYVMDALRAGASGYVPKDSSEEILIQAINQVSTGGIYLAPPLSKRAVEIYAEQARGKNPRKDNDNPFHLLTPRERDVFHLILEDYTNNKIAAHLSISPRTVQTHRANMMKKLRLKNLTELFSFAKNHDLLF